VNPRVRPLPLEQRVDGGQGLTNSLGRAATGERQRIARPIATESGAAVGHASGRKDSSCTGSQDRQGATYRDSCNPREALRARSSCRSAAGICMRVLHAPSFDQHRREHGLTDQQGAGKDDRGMLVSRCSVPRAAR